MSFSNLNIEHMVHLASQHSYKVTCSLVCRGTEARKDPEHIHKVHQNESVCADFSGIWVLLWMNWVSTGTQDNCFRLSLETTTPLLSTWNSFFSFSYTTFSSIEWYTWRWLGNKKCPLMRPEGWLLPSGMPPSALRNAFLLYSEEIWRRLRSPGWIFHHYELLGCELFCLPFSFHAMLRFVCTAAS